MGQQKNALDTSADGAGRQGWLKNVAVPGNPSRRALRVADELTEEQYTSRARKSQSISAIHSQPPKSPEDGCEGKEKHLLRRPI